MLHDALNNGCVAVTPNDFATLGNTIHHIAVAIYVGTGGNLTILGGNTKTTTPATTPVTFKNVPSGTFLPVGATKIISSGTTASDIVVLYRTDR